MAERHEPWIGDCTDGTRRVVRVYDRKGVARYVTADEIVDACRSFETPEAARESLSSPSDAQSAGAGT